MNCDTEMPLSSDGKSTRMFTVALDIINSVVYFGGCVQINLHQCKRLVDFYKRARQFFDVLKRREVSVDEKLYDDALDVLTRGQYLVYGYLETSWLQSVTTAGVNQDAFAKTYVELEDCFRLIYEKSEAGVVACREHKGHKGSYPPIMFYALAPLYFLDEDSRATLFEGDAQKDKEHMLGMIKGSGALDNKDSMFQRIEFTEITIDGTKASLKRKRGVCGILVQELENLMGIPDEESLAQRDRKALVEELSETKENLPKEMLRREQLETKQVAKEKAEEYLRMSDELLKKMEAGNLLRNKGEGLWMKKEAGELLNMEEALTMEKLRSEQVEREKAEALLNLEETGNMLRMKKAEILWRKKQAGKLLEKKEALAKEKLRREQVEKEKAQALLNLKEAENKKEAETLRRKKQAGELLEKKEALAKEKLRRKQVEEELMHLKLVLQQKELEQEQPKHDEPTREDSKQEAQDVPKQEVVNETKVSSSKGTGLPQDFKIRSTEISVLDQIGSGGFATIHKCKWQNNIYAVKIFEGGDVDGLRAEVQNLVLLPRHPNIVLLVGFSIHKDGKPMLVMELLDSDLYSLTCTRNFKKKHQLTSGSEETLVSRLRKGCCLGGQPDLSTPIAFRFGSTPIEVAIDFIYQIAKGMLFLHNRKIFHGDLKCKNVLVKRLPGGRVQLKITDFGVSEKLLIKREHSDIDSTVDLNCSHHSDHSSLGVRHQNGDGKARVYGNVGTLRWMAPEVYGVAGGDTKPYSMKADVYSFSMTCVEILTGEHPFPDWSASKSLREHVKSGGRPHLSKVKDIPRALRELVEMCWDADPLHRPDFWIIYSKMQKLKKRFPIN